MELAQRQQTFITEFAKDGRNTYGTFSHRDQPADLARGLKQAIEAIQFEITVLAELSLRQQTFNAECTLPLLYKRIIGMVGRIAQSVNC